MDNATAFHLKEVINQIISQERYGSSGGAADIHSYGVKIFFNRKGISLALHKFRLFRRTGRRKPELKAIKLPFVSRKNVG